MKYQNPFKLSEISFNNLLYTKIKENNKKKIVYIKYQDKKKLKKFVFQTPSFDYKNNLKSYGKYHEICIPLKCDNEVKELEIENFFNQLDEKILYDAKINNKNWFNKEQIKYQPIIRDKDNNKYIKLKLIKTPDFETILQINNKDKIGYDKIPEDSWAKMILEVYAIWINENGFGLFIRPILISFKPKEKLEYNYNFVEDSSDDDVIDTENEIFMKSDKIVVKTEDVNETTQINLPDVYLEDTDDLSETSSEEKN